jgi:transcriptional regulator with XRE-family HTH domain
MHLEHPGPYLRAQRIGGKHRHTLKSVSARTGYSVGWLSQLETGKRPAPDATVRVILDALAALNLEADTVGSVAAPRKSSRRRSA